MLVAHFNCRTLKHAHAHAHTHGERGVAGAGWRGWMVMLTQKKINEQNKKKNSKCVSLRWIRHEEEGGDGSTGRFQFCLTQGRRKSGQSGAQSRAG